MAGTRITVAGVAVLSLAMVGAAYSWGASESRLDPAGAVAPSQNPEFISLVQQLMVRESMSQSGRADFVKYQFGIAPAEIQRLEQAFVSTRGQDQVGLRAAMDAFLSGLGEEYKAAWEGSIRIGGDEQYAEFVRIPGEDTSQEFLDEAAAATGSVAAAVFEREARWTDYQVVETVRENRSVITEPSRSSVSWLRELDRTASDWSSALDPANDREDQTVTVTQDGDLFKLTYVSPAEGGEEFETVYTFDAARDFAPLSIVSRIGGRIVKSEQYGYEVGFDTAIDRPSEILAYSIDQGGYAKVRLYMVESWTDEVSPEELRLRKPPFHMHIRMDGPGERPVSDIVKPSYFDGIQSGEYADAALEYIVSRLGTDDPEADYDLDGRVTEADLHIAMDLFQTP